MYALDKVKHPNFPCENYYAGHWTLGAARLDGESHTETNVQKFRPRLLQACPKILTLATCDDSDIFVNFSRVQPAILKVHFSEDSLFQRFSVPKAQCSEGSLFRKLDITKSNNGFLTLY